jgi:hypothetical protein
MTSQNIDLSFWDILYIAALIYIRLRCLDQIARNDKEIIRIYVTVKILTHWGTEKTSPI